ncbi:MAG TPA: lysine biosynthesis protein LysW [Acidobacteriota bacterium]|nr:lysine biosynthesis protein LysW [Acidobacteriota bacterium]
MANCIECDAPVTVPVDVLDGEVIPCGDCGAELEVLALEPLSVGLAPAVQEDWGE